MSNFIEVNSVRHGKSLVNTNYIEEIVPNGATCTIYMAFNCPNSIDQDYFEVKDSYQSLKDMIFTVNRERERVWDENN